MWRDCYWQHVTWKALRAAPPCRRSCVPSQLQLPQKLTIGGNMQGCILTGVQHLLFLSFLKVKTTTECFQLNPGRMQGKELAKNRADCQVTCCSVRCWSTWYLDEGNSFCDSNPDLPLTVSWKTWYGPLRNVPSQILAAPLSHGPCTQTQGKRHLVK